MSNKRPYTSPNAIAAASEAACTSIAADLPLLMFGSGDASPDQVDQESVLLLADLTTNYISSLVSAAVNAHDLFTDGKGDIAPSEMHAPSKKRRRRSEGGSDALCVGLDLGTHGPPKPKVSSAIATKSFIFPICHDAELYGKVLDLQAARRDFAHDMLDKVLIDAINEEGGADAELSLAGDLFPVYRN